MPPTIFSQDVDEIKSFFKKNKTIILKPIHSYSGNDILLINNFNLKSIKNILKNMVTLCAKNFYLKSRMVIKGFSLLMERFMVQYQEFQKWFFLSNMSKGAIAININ